ncbi:MAG: riboflavin synthase [Gammaproteobacteria bacterium]|jgi:riboflavin synthase
MFTGLIQFLGKILNIIMKNQAIILRIEPYCLISEYQKGESIAVNGVCLSIINFGSNWFEVYVSRETILKSNLKNLKIGLKVNLERALLIGDRLGGHFVTGHIDTTAKLIKTENIGSSKRLIFLVDKKYSANLVEKGSIALDGISLTLNKCDSDTFEVNIIPETLQKTNVFNWSPGSLVNVEFDLIGKHVQKVLLNSQGAKIEKTILKHFGINNE